MLAIDKLAFGKNPLLVLRLKRRRPLLHRPAKQVEPDHAECDCRRERPEQPGEQPELGAQETAFGRHHQ